MNTRTSCAELLSMLPPPTQTTTGQNEAASSTCMEVMGVLHVTGLCIVHLRVSRALPGWGHALPCQPCWGGRSMQMLEKGCCPCQGGAIHLVFQQSSYQIHYGDT